MSDIKRDPIGQKFYWVTNGEPHAIRRREILTKYGSQVRNLYGYDHRTAWQASFFFARHVSLKHNWRESTQ
jgi:hypothetical protein